MHGRRSAYYIVGEGVCHEPDLLSGGHGCPVGGAPGAPAGASFRFGRMFPLPPRRMTSGEWFELSEGLLRLGLCMNDPVKYCKQEPGPPPPLSDIPAGYTYLGQFIAHEITFDNTQGLPNVEPDPENIRSPSLDLDSIYGAGPGDEQSRRFYEDEAPARLKVSRTARVEDFPLWFEFNNDLHRDQEGKALTGDPRNDENLAVAQTAVAFIRFHNAVVERLKLSHYDEDDLFECARKHVVRHFQWIILYDYLPRIVDAGVLDCVLKHGPKWFEVGCKEGLFMPLEFSAAAFRLGHSMVRQDYEWNTYHSTERADKKPAQLKELFEQTARNGFIGKAGHPPVLPSEWVIDWRRFYQFPQYQTGTNYPPAQTGVNMAARIDTLFDMRLDEVPFDHENLPPEKRAITVRNLLRGFALGLPTGEEVAGCIGETPLRHEEVARGPHRGVLSTRAFKGKTPLWYYILKEAELNGGSRLGPVGSRIVAETFVGLIKNSCYSILNEPRWYPKYTRRDPGTASARFEMADLIDFAGGVNPVAKM